MDAGHFVPYAYRPFDIRWLFWYPKTKLLDEKRDELFQAFRKNAVFITSRAQAERSDEGSPFYATRALPDRHLTRPGSACFPSVYRDEETGPRSLFDIDAGPVAANLSQLARTYCRDLNLLDTPEHHLWNHALSTGHSPLYLKENADGIELDWPRIPLPSSRDRLLNSSALGAHVLELLLVEHDVAGVTSGKIRPELRNIGVIEREDGKPIDPDAGDLKITVGWGHPNQGGVVFPSQGKLDSRPYTPAEKASIEQLCELLGERTLDLYLNEQAVVRNVPQKVWDYALGGYQVIRKWLSYFAAQNSFFDLAVFFEPFRKVPRKDTKAPEG
jgi:hypothetical protein